MQERADHLGARIAITSTPGHGVLVSVRVPLGVLVRDTSQPIADADRSPAPAMAHTQG
jgi:signal transduction histidine kinase